MILTNCAACAAPLGLASGKKCGRCSTRYCGPACQKQHWDGGHKELCKKIKKTGGAEQYNANKKYSEAVAVAAEKCADDTKGQTCFICTQALHWKTKEGLVRGCSCRGTAGFAHVSCLAEQAKILVAEAEENNLGEKVWRERWARWHTCSLCKQAYHSAVRGALGWACWKTYLGRPERDSARMSAMTQLGNGLTESCQHVDALSVKEAQLATMRRVGASGDILLVVQANLAMTYQQLGRLEDASLMQRDVYSGWLKLTGEEDVKTLRAANNCAWGLINLRRFEEARKLLRKMTPVARRTLGDDNSLTLVMRWAYARSYGDTDATLDDLREAETTLEETARTARRFLGCAHPDTLGIEKSLRDARAALRARETADDLAARFGGLL